jgi:hypothetical protein
MKVGDLVRDSDGDIGIIVGRRDSGFFNVQFAEAVWVVAPRWLEVICK